MVPDVRVAGAEKGAPLGRFLFALYDGGGSLPPELAVVRQVLAAGHEVTIVGDPTIGAEVAAAGVTDFRVWAAAPVRASRLAEDDYLRDWEVRSPLALFHRLLDNVMIGPAPAFAADTMALIDELRPDAVVTSFLLLGVQLAAEVRGLPWAVLSPNAGSLPTRGMPPPGMLPARGQLGRVRDGVFLALSGPMANRGLPQLNEVRASLGLRPATRMFEQFESADRLLKLTSRSFDFPMEHPANVRYVGPQLDDPEWVDAWSDSDSGGLPLVLVSMSTNYMRQVEVLSRIIEALGSLPVRGLVTTGPAVDPSTFAAPANVHVVSSAPHGQVLPHAALLVTHGGHGTIMKSLVAGVPIVCVPLGRDQPDNAARLRFHGVGVQVSRRASVRRLRGAIKDVLSDPGYAERAAALGERIAADAGSTAVLSELEALLARV